MSNIEIGMNVVGNLHLTKRGSTKHDSISIASTDINSITESEDGGSYLSLFEDEIIVKVVEKKSDIVEAIEDIFKYKGIAISAINEELNKNEDISKQ